MKLFYLIGFYFGRVMFELVRGKRDGFAPNTGEKDRDIRIMLMEDPKKNYIPAIKLHRINHGSLLRDAKNAVDSIRLELGI